MMSSPCRRAISASRARAGRVHDPAERVVQGRHRVDGPDRAGRRTAARGRPGRCRPRPTAAAPVPAERAGEDLEARVGEGVDRDHVPGPQRRHDRGGQPVLRAVDDQDLVGVDREPAQPQMAGDRGPVLRPAAMGLVAQQRLKIAGCRQLPQGAAQQVGLAGQGGVVEAEVDGVRGRRLLVDAVAGRQGDVADERSPALLAADQAHGLQLGVDPGRGHQRDALAGRELPVGGQPGPGGQAARADVRRERVDHGLVARDPHGVDCMHDNSLTVMDRAN